MEKTVVLWKKLWYYSKIQLTIVNYSLLQYFLLGKTSGHLGVTKRLARLDSVITGRDYKGMCTITRRTNPIPKRQTRRKQVVVSVLSVEKTATDILCELSEETDRGNRHILIVSDCFTKWHLLFQIWRQKLLLEHGKSFRPRSPVRKQNMYRNVSVAWNL